MDTEGTGVALFEKICHGVLKELWEANYQDSTVIFHF